jgi:hypothetical protein
VNEPGNTSLPSTMFWPTCLRATLTTTELDQAATATVIASIRHRHTKYDRLLMKGYERAAARDAVRQEIGRVLESWRFKSQQLEARGTGMSTIQG